eukprot:TRINITY_DN16473_c0_g1_i1.p1 TRINITY_DN16473_c0_g1~~TRINITY_DN16473_c0_g1_i1.p1  ORF type:complete len:2044 (+),score=250.98 TRINITY_DN16473_c0_g1_i1:333-6134(+)
MPDLQALPFVATPIMVFYNLPGLKDPLVLSTTVLSLIFNGTITAWNDTRIAADNPSLTLPSAPIIVVVRPDTSGTTKLFTSALAAFDPLTWPAGGFQEPTGWPASLKYVVAAKTGNGELIKKVLATQYSVGYGPLQVASLGATFARIELRINSSNTTTDVTVLPDTAAIQEGLSEQPVSPKLLVSATAMQRKSGGPIYPIVALSYALIRLDSLNDTDVARLLTYLMHFALTAHGRRTAIKEAFVPPPLLLGQRAIDRLFEIKVNGARVRSPPLVTGYGSNTELWREWAAIYGFTAATRVTYDGETSVRAKALVAARSALFAGSELAMGATSLSNGNEKPRRSQAIPVYVTGVALAYNLPGVDDELVISQAAIVGLFNGSISRWNDPLLRITNPFIALADEEIKVVVPIEASGLTEILKQRLAAFNTQWQEEHGVSASSDWPQTLSSRLVQTENVPLMIKKLEFSIGIAALFDSQATKVTTAAVVNDVGSVVQPSVAAYEAAVEGFTSPSGTLNGNAYPIVGFSYLFRSELDSNQCSDAQELTKFAQFITEDPAARALAREQRVGALPVSLSTYVKDLLTEKMCSKAVPVLAGKGTPSATSLVKMWNRDQPPELPYTEMNGLPALTDVSERVIDFTLTAAPPGQRLPEVTVIPVAAVPLVLLYNIPGFGPGLTLPRQVLPKLMTGQIAFWDSPELTAANPGFSLPNKEIILFRHGADSGSTFAMTSALSHIDSSWNSSFGTFLSPDNWPAVANARLSLDIPGDMRTVPYSLGYAFLVDTLRFGDDVFTATLINKAGRPTVPNIAAVNRALEFGNLDSQTLLLDAYDVDSQEAYPIVAPLYFGYRPAALGDECQRQKALQDLLLWILSDSHNPLAEQIGFAGLRGDTRASARETVFKIICDDTPLRTDVIVPTGVTMAQMDLHARLTSQFSLAKLIQFDTHNIETLKAGIPTTALLAGVSFPPRSEDLTNRVAIPAFASGLVACYNLPDITDLVLSLDALVGFFNGTVQRWNAYVVSRLNPFRPLPDQPVNVIIRAEDSGTAIAIRSFFSAYSKQFATTFGVSPSSNWTATSTNFTNQALFTPVTGGDAALAAAVATTPYSFAILPSSQAGRSCSPAAIINTLGLAVQYSPTSVAAAVETSVLTERNVDVLPPQASSLNAYPYPLSLFSLYLVRLDWIDCSQKVAATAYLRWALTAPEAFALITAQGFVAPPAAVLQDGLDRLDKQKCTNGLFVGPFNLKWLSQPSSDLSDAGLLGETVVLVITDGLGNRSSALDGTSAYFDIEPVPLDARGTTASIVNGAAVFSQLVVKGVHGTRYRFTARIAGSRAIYSELQLSFEAIVQRCTLLDNYAVLNSTECRSCPSGGSCNGSSAVVPLPGFWRSGNRESLNFVRCSSTSVCPGGDNPCLEGHSGILCAACLPGYGRNSRAICERCNLPRDVTILVLTITAAIAVVYWFLSLNIPSPNSKLSPTKVDAAVLLRMFFTHVQMTQLALSAFDEWQTGLFSALHSAVSGVSTSMKDFVFLNCLLGLSSYGEFLVLLFLPAFVLVVSLLYCAVRYYRENNSLPFFKGRFFRSPGSAQTMSQYEAAIPSCVICEQEFAVHRCLACRNRAYCSKCFHLAHFRKQDHKPSPICVEGPSGPRLSNPGVVLFLVPALTMTFLVYPSVVRGLVTLLICSQPLCDASGNCARVLLTDVTVSCEDTKYAAFLAASYILVAVYGIGIPVLGFILLRHHKSTLHTHEIVRRYGFLYMGYRRKYYFWEMVVMAEKGLFIVALYKLTYDGLLRAYSGVGFLAVAVLLNATNRPHRTSRLRLLQNISLQSILILLWVICLLHSPAVSSHVALILEYLVLVINVIVIVTLLYDQVLSIHRHLLFVRTENKPRALLGFTVETVVPGPSCCLLDEKEMLEMEMYEKSYHGVALEEEEDEEEIISENQL